MARSEYPLEALRKLRDERADAEAKLLAEQVARSESAQVKLIQRERARREHAARAADSVRVERERLAEGDASGVDLQRVADFEKAIQVQAELLMRAEAEARQALSEARAEEQKLRQQLAELEAEAKLVRNHEAGFHEQKAAVQQKAEEEAALEQWNARRR